MNPIQQEILRRLEALPDDLAILRTYAAKSARYCSSIGTGDILQLGHQPWVGSEAYAVVLFAPAKKAWITAFKERTGCGIPTGYRDALLAVNGCSVHGLTLYGLAPSMQGPVPRPNRSGTEPLDLAMANLTWARGFATDPAQFHFGGRELTDDENSGYFWSEGRPAVLRAVRTSGEVVGEWPDLRSLLSDELAAAEQRVEASTPADWWK